MKRAGFSVVVDDDEGVRTSLRALLDSNGYSVCLAKDIRETLQQLEHQIPELLICDYMLEDETILRLTLADEFSGIPVRVLLTAHDPGKLDPDLVRQFTDVVRKSAGTNELLAAISKHRCAE